MKTRAHVYISGRVQGVFFRSSVADLAVGRDLTGWVRNLFDGRVETVLEGEKESVEDVIEFCRRGPPGAHVNGLDLEWERWRGEFTEFKIVH